MSNFSFGNIANTEDFSFVLGFALLSCIIAFAWAPILIGLLYRFRMTRHGNYDPTLLIESRKDKANTPVMGGLLVIITVAAVTMALNWSRSYTYVPIAVMLLSSALGAVDDILNRFGGSRRNRTISHVWTLIRVHKNFLMRVWYVIILPWAVFKRLVQPLGSKQNRGVQAHEKLALQFAAGAITAWWIYFRLGEAWHSIYIPFLGDIQIGWAIIPLIIFIVVFTANSVNIADGMDGLAGGMLIPTFGALSLLSWFGGFQELAVLNATVTGSLIAYTYFNVKPARFQMGDVGSLGLGALLAINALAIGQISSLIFLALVFYVEALSVIVQVAGKLLLGRRIFRMAPIHHHFELIGWSEEKTIMRFWILHLFFIILGIWLGLH